MKLSVIIPAHNEEGSIASTLEPVALTLEREGIEHEILVVDDHSADGTAAGRVSHLVCAVVMTGVEHRPRGDVADSSRR